MPNHRNTQTASQTVDIAVTQCSESCLATHISFRVCFISLTSKKLFCYATPRKIKVTGRAHSVRTVPCFTALIYVCAYFEIYGEFEFRKYKRELLCIVLVMSSQCEK